MTQEATTMTYYDIQCYAPINDVDPEKVNALVADMLANGWRGAPILVFGESLLTGSHRITALRKIARDPDIDDAEVLHQDVAEDVTEIVEAALQRRADELGMEPWEIEIDYRNIGWILEGTEYEKYKDEIAEW
jgi:hypothetical protein